MSKEITAHQCDYCTKIYIHKSSAKRHEKVCFYNCKTKSCATCANFTQWSDRADDGVGNQIEMGGDYCEAVDREFFNRKDEEPLRLKSNCALWEARDE